MKFVLFAFLSTVGFSAMASHFECEATAQSNNQSYSLALYTDKLETCMSGYSCIQYNVRNCQIRTVEGPHSKVQLEGTCEWNPNPGQVSLFDFSNSPSGFLTDFGIRASANAPVQVLNNYLDCEVVEN